MFAAMVVTFHDVGWWEFGTLALVAAAGLAVVLVAMRGNTPRRG